jgi:endonuclease YncB( thermonuclease family)
MNRRCLGISLLALLIGLPAQARELNSYAFVDDDGSLRIRNRTVRLHGILIPPTDKTCLGNFRPVRCGSRAKLALEFRIGARFVRCVIHGEYPDGSLDGSCYLDDTDLAAYLLERGWAAAAPDAPPIYAVLERIARHRSLGVWGTPVDRIID